MVPQVVLSPPLISPFPESHEMTLTGFSVPYSYMYRKCLNHIHPPLTSPFCCCLHLSMTYFTLLSFIVLVSIHCSVGFCLGIFTCKYIVLYILYILSWLFSLFSPLILYWVSFAGFKRVIIGMLNLKGELVRPNSDIVKSPFYLRFWHSGG
jgi:hypothetical protein